MTLYVDSPSFCLLPNTRSGNGPHVPNFSRGLETRLVWSHMSAQSGILLEIGRKVMEF
jgi:hypothetical protein